MFISDYVLATYGTGDYGRVPAHDTRDWDFAKKFGLPIVEVVSRRGRAEGSLYRRGGGRALQQRLLNGLSVAQAKRPSSTGLV